MGKPSTLRLGSDAILGAFVGVTLIVAFAAAPVAAAESVGAERFVVATRPVSDLKAVFATVESVDLALARARIGGTVEDLRVDEGSAVRQGEVIARVDDPKLPLQLAALDAQIEAHNAQRAQALIDLERARKLRASGTGTQARLDEAQTNLDVVTGAVAAKRAERAVVSEQAVEGAVLAPASGRVLRVHVVAGAVIRPGEIVATIAAESYVLRMMLPERHARFLKIGDKVRVGARGMAAADQDLVEGRVRQVYPELDQGRVVADVTVEGLGDFFIGERTRVYVATGVRDAIVVPKRYLFTRFGITYATLDGGVEVVVQPGRAAQGGIEILSGLTVGDVLIPSGK